MVPSGSREICRKLDYFPGGAGKTGSCGCGATQSCDDKDVTCNCNIDDGVGRKDFGVIIDKSDLPVTKVTAQIGIPGVRPT